MPRSPRWLRSDSSSTPWKYSSGRLGRPEWRSASKYSSGLPATPVSASAWQTRVLPLRGVAQTRYERSGIMFGFLVDHVNQQRGKDATLATLVAVPAASHDYPTTEIRFW